MNKIANSKIAIIILVWNDYKNTFATIKSVLKSKEVDFDIYVVDNASTNDCIKLLKEDFMNCDNVSFLINDFNWGYAEGNNIAIRKCMNWGYDYFYILNNDVIFDSDYCIHDMWITMKNDENIGILAPLIWNKQKDGHFVKGTIMTNSRLYNLMMRKNNVELGEYKEGLFRVPTVSGSFMAITRKCIEKNKGFEKNFFMYGEEDDLCLRTNLNGMKVVKLSKDYGIKHLGGILDFVSVADWKRVASFRNRLLLTRSFPLSQIVLYCFILFFQGLNNSLKLIKNKNVKSAIIYFVAFFEGLHNLVWYKRLSKSSVLFDRGRKLAMANSIYGIKVK